MEGLSSPHRVCQASLKERRDGHADVRNLRSALELERVVDELGEPKFRSLMALTVQAMHGSAYRGWVESPSTGPERAFKNTSRSLASCSDKRMG